MDFFSYKQSYLKNPSKLHFHFYKGVVLELTLYWTIVKEEIEKYRDYLYMSIIYYTHILEWKELIKQLEYTKYLLASAAGLCYDDVWEPHVEQ